MGNIPIIGPILSPKMPKLPPGPDAELLEREKQAEAELAKEKKRLIAGKAMGMQSTILTGGQGVEEEATTSRTLLGGY
jgi:hypothetical protein|tara:strand:- start:1194 stop:1427 length:234 start_codon:yes stop_codon:yes gene_type:complete